MSNVTKNGLTFREEIENKDFEGFSVAKKLVRNLFFDMSELCTHYCNNRFCDMPYSYSERSLDSVLLPALSKLCNYMVWVEYPTERKLRGKAPKNGRIDYVCIYQGYTFVIELKHGYDCFNSDYTKSTVFKRWDEMTKQLNSVERYVKLFEESTKGVIRIGLQIVSSYSETLFGKAFIERFHKSIPRTFKQFKRDLKPDIMICWEIPEKTVKQDPCKIPGLWALAKIYDPLTHKGSKQQ